MMRRTLLVLGLTLAFTTTAMALGPPQILTDPRGDSKGPIDIRRVVAYALEDRMTFHIETQRAFSRTAANRPCIHVYARPHFSPSDHYEVGCHGSRATLPTTPPGGGVPVAVTREDSRSIDYTFSLSAIGGDPDALPWYATTTREGNVDDRAPNGRGFRTYVQPGENR